MVLCSENNSDGETKTQQDYKKCLAMSAVNKDVLVYFLLL
jgi:hypothetical protein